MLLMVLMKAKKLMILFSIIVIATMIPILMSNYYRSSNSRTLSATAAAAIPDRDDDERPCCSVHTFAAAAITSDMEVTISYSAHSFLKETHINMANVNLLEYDKGDSDDCGSCSFVLVVHIRMHIHLLIVIAVVTR